MTPVSTRSQSLAPAFGAESFYEVRIFVAGVLGLDWILHRSASQCALGHRLPPEEEQQHILEVICHSIAVVGRVPLAEE